MSIAEEPVFQWLSQFAFQPGFVYTALIAMMLLSAFGLPIPEELTLLSVGLLAFLGANPHLFPPPYPGAPIVHPTEAAIVATIAVFGADFLVYLIGRFGGRRLIQHPRLSRFFPPAMLAKAENFIQKYGALATGIFRFTPGVRFPGHLLCGMLKFPAWKFAAVDAVAVSISVPTQVLLLAHYGEPILNNLRQFKTVVFSLLGLAVLAFVIYRWRQKRLEKAAVAIPSRAADETAPPQGGPLP